MAQPGQFECIKPALFTLGKGLISQNIQVMQNDFFALVGELQGLLNVLLKNSQAG